jgi:hypothetical protein
MLSRQMRDGADRTVRPMFQKTVWAFRCERCGHEWTPRKPWKAGVRLPVAYPKCKSPYSNRPRKNPRTQEQEQMYSFKNERLFGIVAETDYRPQTGASCDGCHERFLPGQKASGAMMVSSDGNEVETPNFHYAWV